MSVSGISPIDESLMRTLMQILKDKNMGHLPADVLRELVIQIIRDNIESQKATAEELIQLISSYNFDTYA
ncbi:MAG: hypothetical protein GXO59_02945 [Dictyoglomi bacterium]|nr:hypothetical protein [Dictyoglomota bacterium]